MGKKFDFVIGNPPYQDNTIGDNKNYAPPVYDKFITASKGIARASLLIHPGRFLFNAGSTSKQWNKEMLNDPHFKIIYYAEKSSDIFPNTDIKGGIAVSYYDASKNFGPIDVFTPYAELNSIYRRVIADPKFISMETEAVTGYAYHFTKKMYEDFPNAIKDITKGHEFDLKSNVFEKIPYILTEEKHSENDAEILGRENNQRKYRYIKRDYLNDVINFDSYKIFLPRGIGTGAFGETIPEPIVSFPGVGATETFMSIGKLKTEQEARNLGKYLKSKFTRALLGILKKTQINTPGVWHYVPLQVLDNTSDIDWSKSISEIDQQLYKKYSLSPEEIEFIETNVKEMN